MSGVDVARAIATVEDSRRTHVEWRDWLENERPDCGHESCLATFEVRVQTAGDVEHQQRCIDEYDHVLSVLRTVPDLMLVSGGIGSDTLAELERRDARWHTALRERNEARAAVDRVTALADEKWRCDCDPGPEGQHRPFCASWFATDLRAALVAPDTQETTT